MNGTAGRRTIGTMVVSAVLALTIAACGGGSSSSAPSVISNESTTSTTSASSSTTAPGSSGSSRLGDALGTTGACVELGLAYASVSLSLLGGGFGAALGQDQSELDSARQQLADVQADVPAELKDDFAALETAFGAFSSALSGGSGNILDPAYQQQLEAAGKALETPEVTAAQRNIETYLDQNCGGG